jgi:hypothetical protein
MLLSIRFLLSLSVSMLNNLSINDNFTLVLTTFMGLEILSNEGSFQFNHSCFRKMLIYLKLI